MFSTSTASHHIRPRRLCNRLMILGTLLYFCSGVSAAYAAFSGEPASQGILDSVCFFPRRLKDVDAGQGGALVAAAPVSMWTMVVSGTIRSRDGDPQHSFTMDPVDLTGVPATNWSSFVDNRVVPLVKAKYKLP